MGNRNIEDYLTERIEGAFGEAAPPDDLYVVSLWITYEDDDPRVPVLRVGFNTEARVAEQTDFASSTAEARWNFAYWLQNELDAVGGRADPHGGASFSAWLVRDCGLSFTDAEEAADPDRTADLDAQMEFRVLRMVADTAALLHERGTLARTIGGAVPIIVHELEYVEEIAVQNERANHPDVLPAEFGIWCREG